MNFFFRRVILGGLVLSSVAWGQMHKVARPEQVVRAIGVYEWTGDLAKPTASRLIPVSIFIDGKLQDAGVYVSRPVPFALLSGNVYELQQAGIGKGLLDLAFARHMQQQDAAGDSAWDDGWFGYGTVKLMAPPRVAALKPSKNAPVLMSSKGPVPSTPANGAAGTTAQPKSSGTASSPNGDQSKSAGSTSSDDPDRPTMKRRSSADSGDSGGTGSSGTNGSSASSTSSAGKPSDDPDRPVMKRRSDSSDSGSGTQDSSGNSGSSNGSSPANDPDRPTMKRRSDSSGDSGSGTGGSSGGSNTGTASSGSTPADDPDRPTMKRRSDNTPDSTTGTASTAGNEGSSGSSPANDPDRPTLKRHTPEDAKKAGVGMSSAAEMASLNDDPNRPTLHHGKPTGSMTDTDLPKLQGLPVNVHQMVAVSDAVTREPHEFAMAWDNAAQRATVLEKMQEMARAQLAAYSGAAAPAPPAKTAPAAKTAAARAATARAKRAAPAAPLVMLMDEDLKAYRLSYGGAATYVYTAHTAGTGAALRYVTVVAQEDGLGELKPAIRTATDAAHLDRTPWMKFVDVVDAEASNRASLLFELRGQNSRQFGLYRVIAAHSEQIFVTGTTQ